ncbi:hypothetical protein GOV06_00690 [Candidatus Woesearchaeota archaeon]|nr:hypothetical protein [Candidatus Woesearchaeota archaeon]
MNSKKAQIIGQVFIFILAAGLAVLIIGYGYNAISSFTSRTEDIAFINFKTDLQTEVRTMASDFGSVKRLDLNMPGRFQMLCLIDLNKRNIAATSCLCTQCQGIYKNDYQPEICDAWTTSGNLENAFLVPITPFKLSSMEIENGYICIFPRGNKISLKIEGRGDRTKVSEWT